MCDSCFFNTTIFDHHLWCKPHTISFLKRQTVKVLNLLLISLITHRVFLKKQHQHCVNNSARITTHSDTLTSRTLFSLSSSLSWASLSLRTVSSLLMSSAANLSGSTWMSFGMRYVRCIQMQAQKLHAANSYTHLLLKFRCHYSQLTSKFSQQ